MRPGCLILLAAFAFLPRFLSAAEPASEGLTKRFEELRTKYQSQFQQVGELYKEANGDSERLMKLLATRHPANTMVKDFLALEQQSRGTLVGFSCLCHLVVAPISFATSDLPAAESKQTAIELLREHYADHPDLDVPLSLINYGPHAGDAGERLLERATQSPHRHVRGTAYYQLASYLKEKATLPAWCKSMRGILTDADAGEWEAQMLDQLEINYPDSDTKRSRERALAVTDTILNDYADVPIAPRAGPTPVLIEVQRNPNPPPGSTLGSLTKPMQYELQHLGIGTEAPEIDRPDAFGEPLRLSEQKGKVVVLLFSFKGCVPCEQGYPANRKLIEDMAGRPFVFLGIMGDKDASTTKEAASSEAVTWKVWWAGPDRELCNQWNVMRFPSIYVLDQTGVIRFKNLPPHLLNRAVEKLVAEADAD